MTTKSMVKSAWPEYTGQFFYSQNPDTSKITRRLVRTKSKITNSGPSSLTKLA